jgi:hypothetical protein
MHFYNFFLLVCLWHITCFHITILFHHSQFFMHYPLKQPIGVTLDFPQITIPQMEILPSGPPSTNSSRNMSSYMHLNNWNTNQMFAHSNHNQQHASQSLPVLPLLFLDWANMTWYTFCTEEQMQDLQLTKPLKESNYSTTKTNDILSLTLYITKYILQTCSRTHAVFWCILNRVLVTKPLLHKLHR